MLAWLGLGLEFDWGLGLGLRVTATEVQPDCLACTIFMTGRRNIGPPKPVPIPAPSQPAAIDFQKGGARSGNLETALDAVKELQEALSSLQYVPYAYSSVQKVAKEVTAPP